MGRNDAALVLPRDAVLSRDLEAARRAWKNGDPQESALAHQRPRGKEVHSAHAAVFMKSVVFGGMDGIMTTFAIVAGSSGANLSPTVVLIIGFANLVADAISMGVGDYVSSVAEIEHARTEMARESWELENFPKGEIDEMVELYESKGVQRADAELIINTMAKYKEFFVEHMMVTELGVMPPDPDESPAAKGICTFLAFMVFGAVPLLVLGVLRFATSDHNTVLLIACIATAITLFLLGIIKARLSGNGRYVRAGSTVLFNGAIAAGSAYLIGWALSLLFST
ncbi:VIT family [Plasmodiophora brassicae]